MTTKPPRRRLTITLDPTGEHYGIPTYPWRCAPPGLATYRQLAKDGLRPGGQDPVAQVIRRPRSPLIAYLYRVDLAKPKRPVTPAMLAASAAAIAAKRVCDSCHRDRGYIPPNSTGYRCWDCAGLPAPAPTGRAA